jgi:hypothetical protein
MIEQALEGARAVVFLLRDDPVYAGECRKLLGKVGLDDESLKKYKQ